MISFAQKNIKICTIASIIALVSAALLMISKFSNEYTAMVVFILYDLFPVILTAIFAIFIAYFAPKSLKLTFIPLAVLQTLYIVLSMFYYNGNLYGKKGFNFIFGLNEIIFDLAPFIILFTLVLFFINEIKSFKVFLILLSVAAAAQIGQTVYSYINLEKLYIPFFMLSQLLLLVCALIIALPEKSKIKIDESTD